MNQNLAVAIANLLREKWDLALGPLYSETIYKELIAQGHQVPEGDMKEIFDKFIQAGIINGHRNNDWESSKQHGCMLITLMDMDLLDQLDFD